MAADAQFCDGAGRRQVDTMIIQAIGLIEEIAREEGHFKQAEARAMLDAMR